MICAKCKQDLSESEFSPGLLKYRPSFHICRVCKREMTKEYTHKNPQKKREYDKRYLDKRKERHLAKIAINIAIKHRGFKRQPCQICGRNDDVEGHHLSYLEEDWLTVVWLCPVCHKGAHYGTVDISGLQTYTASPIRGRWGELAKVN